MKRLTENYIIYVKYEEKTVKELEMHKFSVCAYKFQDFARLHDRATVTFRNSDG